MWYSAAMTTDMDWQTFRLEFDALIDSIKAEIRGYPGPIAGCDAQFNHLLEQRRLLTEERARLDRAAGDGSQSVEEFLGASPCAETLRGLTGQARGKRAARKAG